MKLLGRILYAAGLLACAGIIATNPPWLGQGYDSGESGWSSAESFELRSSDSMNPVWDPPDPASDGRDATIRWPWQEPDQDAHIELSSFGLAWRLALGVLLAGIGLQFWTKLTNRGEPDWFANLAWSLSLGVAGSVVILVGYWLLSDQFRIPDRIVLMALPAGGALGLLYGIISFRPDEAGKSATTFSRLGWFAAGLGGSIAIVMTSGYASLLFRESGDPLEPGTINLATGAVVVAVGTATAWMANRWKTPRGLSEGLFVGSAILGILYALAL